MTCVILCAICRRPIIKQERLICHTSTWRSLASGTAWITWVLYLFHIWYEAVMWQCAVWKWPFKNKVVYYVVLISLNVICSPSVRRDRKRWSSVSNCGCIVSTRLGMSSSSRETYRILFILPANRRLLDWGHYCCLQTALPFYFTMVVLIFFAFLAAVQMVVLLMELTAGKKYQRKQVSLQARPCRQGNVPLAVWL